MTTKQLIKEESIKFWFSLAATAIGVFIALFVNNMDKNNKENESYQSMLTAIKAEAQINYEILEKSFKKYSSDDKIDIKNEFTFKISEEFLKSDIFLNHTNQIDIERISTYILNLKKANTFKDYDKNFKKENRYNLVPIDSSLVIFRNAFKSTLNECEDSILLMTNFNENFNSK